MNPIKNMSVEHLQTLLNWARDEGWNPGLDDAAAFFAGDPAGFFMATKHDQLAAGISVIKQDSRNGFLGLYICKPEYRGQGVGWAVWQAGIHYLDGMTIGLDGVVEQQDNYKKSGFDLAYRNIRYSGVPEGLAGVQSEFQSETQLDNQSKQHPQSHSAHHSAHRTVQSADLPGIAALDQSVHGLDRQAFISQWVTDTEHRQTLVATGHEIAKHEKSDSNGQDVEAATITGFGTIRACHQGHKVGPLIAKDQQAALALLSALMTHSGAREIILDVPEPNAAALALAESIGLKPVFETARMYRGTPPEYDLQRLFGVTTFELG